MESYVLTASPRATAEICCADVEMLLRKHGVQRFAKAETQRAVHLRFSIATIAGLNGELTAAEERLRIDLNLQTQAARDQRRRLFAFDMDSTLIEMEVIDELAKLAGVGQQVSTITAAAMRGELDFKESFRRRMALLRGVREEEVSALLDRVSISTGAIEVFAALKRAGCVTAILSGGFSLFAEHLQQRFGIDCCHTNRLAFADGVLTGEVSGDIVDGAGKAAALRELANARRIPLAECVAVGDGANDLPMLAIAGVGVAYHAKPVLRSAAPLRLSYSSLDTLLELVAI